MSVQNLRINFFFPFAKQDLYLVQNLLGVTAVNLVKKDSAEKYEKLFWKTYELLDFIQT